MGNFEFVERTGTSSSCLDFRFGWSGAKLHHGWRMVLAMNLQQSASGLDFIEAGVGVVSCERAIKSRAAR